MPACSYKEGIVSHKAKNASTLRQKEALWHVWQKCPNSVQGKLKRVAMRLGVFTQWSFA
jgi:hypothetical protein